MKTTRKTIVTPEKVHAVIRRLTAFDFIEAGDLPDLFAGIATPEQGTQVARRNPAKLRELYRVVLTKGVLRYGDGKIVTAPPDQVPDESTDYSWEELPDAEGGFLFQEIMRFTGGGQAAAAAPFPAQPPAISTPGSDVSTVFDLTLHDAAGTVDRSGN